LELKKLSAYKHIIIQCHNIPDADTIACAFALQAFLRSSGAEAAIIYGGEAEISKPNLLMLIEDMSIDICRAESVPPQTDLLITVDCQRGAGNVYSFDLPAAADIAIIDHHKAEVAENDYTLILPHLASCSTLVWDLLRKEGFSMDERVKTALFYGLYTDTNGLAELRHPLDRDLAEIPHNAGLIKKLKNSAITLDELDIISTAFLTREIIGGIGLFRARPCDANLLGFTSDIVQQVAHIDCCLVYCLLKHGVKLSVRGSTREIMASEIAQFVCRGAGSGGGNIEKAGGFISFNGIKKIGGDIEPETYLKSRIHAYIDNYDLIYAGNNNIDFKAMPLYRKLPLPVGYVKSADILPQGAKITIRTLEGDIDAAVSADIYLIVGIQGEVYPILRERFAASYIPLNEAYDGKAEYIPAIINRISGERIEIMSAAKACVPKGTKLLRAEALGKDAKVFSYWDSERYFYGGKGDYLAANEDAYDDCYIIRKDIFAETYERVL
jgi:phosphoglycolate phosphatase